MYPHPYPLHILILNILDILKPLPISLILSSLGAWLPVALQLACIDQPLRRPNLLRPNLLRPNLLGWQNGELPYLLGTLMAGSYCISAVRPRNV